MSTSAAVYFIILISGSTRLEVQSKPPLTLSQCYKAGADWTARGPNHQYECRRIKQP